MEPREVLSALEAMAVRLGIDLRVEPLSMQRPPTSGVSGRGGLCWVRGRPTVLVDARLPILDRIGILAAALDAFDLAFVHVPPTLRARRTPPTRARTPSSAAHASRATGRDDGTPASDEASSHVRDGRR